MNPQWLRVRSRLGTTLAGWSRASNILEAVLVSPAPLGPTRLQMSFFSGAVQWPRYANIASPFGTRTFHRSHRCAVARKPRDRSSGARSTRLAEGREMLLLSQ